MALSVLKIGEDSPQRGPRQDVHPDTRDGVVCAWNPHRIPRLQIEEANPMSAEERQERKIQEFFDFRLGTTN